MPGRTIKKIIIHCSATANGVALGSSGRTAAQIIDVWHGRPEKDRAGKVIRPHMFQRSSGWRSAFNPHLWHIGYHWVIDTDGSRHSGRHVNEQGAHVASHNSDSIGICMVGTDRYTVVQWNVLRSVVTQHRLSYPDTRLAGHRDLSPDKDGDGEIEPLEWLKTCPGFDVSKWFRGKMAPIPGHVIEESSHA